MTNEQQAQAEMPIWLVIVLALGGANVAIGLYERWAAKRLGVCEVPPDGGQPR
ncbi:phage holin family protein [Pseudomonas sp. OV226]|uniref:phage holin family protein n=1 Tax=Pseudomonas sp. OV226 TaxID=2135588 RepID=UPI000D6AD471|nr:phage holin family protein [Pseudomonas sp. OV226]